MATTLEAVGASLALPNLRKAVPGLDPKLERLLGAIAQVCMYVCMIDWLIGTWVGMCV
jgi:hypothetical protein